MKILLPQLLSCPICGDSLGLSKAPDEIEERVLLCARCHRSYPVHGGVPDFLETGDRTSHVAESFGFEWKLHHHGGFEKGTVFGRTIDQDVKYFYDGLGLPEQPLSGVILDAGCGSAVLTAELARRNPEATVIGLDINSALSEAARKFGSIPNLHLVRGSVLQPPIMDGSIDYLWSNGVIHHTGDTRRAFDALTAKVKPGGRAYIWVYERKLSPMVALRLLLLPLGLTRWNRWVLYRFCQAISIPTYVAVKCLRILGRLPFVRSNTHLRILTLDRSYRQLVLTWFDVLSPKYRDTLSRREFESWFAGRGFGDLMHYHWPVGVSGTRSNVASETQRAAGDSQGVGSPLTRHTHPVGSGT